MDPLLASIIMFAGNFAPRNWAYCQGQLLPINQNAALYSLLGTTYGGNGTTTFALPDLRGRVPVGTGVGVGAPTVDLGELSGASTIALSIANMPAHSHTVTVTPRGVTDAGDVSDPTNAFPANSGALDKEYKATGTFVNMGASAAATSSVAGSSTPFNNMQPYLGMNYIIALQGIFPSRN